MKKIIVIGGKHIQDHEFFYPKYRLTEEPDFQVIVATPGGEECSSNKGSIIKPDLAIEGLNVENFDGLVIPGGALAIEYLRQNKELIRVTREFNEQRKPIAVICQGSQILISAGAVKGRTVSGYYSIQLDIENAGGTYLDLPAVIDRNLCTTAHYKDMGPWMHEFVSLINQN
jgi:protease I